MSVQCRAPIKGFRANATLVRLLFRMYNLMSTQCARLTKAFAANLADERPNTCMDRHVSS